MINVFGTSFTANTSLKAPDTIPMAIHTGVWGMLFKRNRFTWDASFDIQDMTNILDGFATRIHMGTEGAFWVGKNKMAALRLGLNQGYLTFGGGVNFWILKANFAYYTQETGPKIGMRPETKYIFNLQLGF